MIPFGKKIRVGNFYVMKTTKVLSKKELSTMRKERGITEEVSKRLHRYGMPLITIGDIAGGWKISYAPTMSVYQFIDNLTATTEGIVSQAEEESLRNLILLVYMGSTILGDKELNMERVRIHNEFSERAGANTSTEETAEQKAADDKITEEEAKSHRDADTIVDMMETAAKDKEDEV